MTTSKTSASDLFNRYIWLANTIYSAGKISFEEIAAKWKDSYWNNDHSELPVRTFHDHRKAVEELFDIDIQCDKRDGFKYYIENSDDIEKGNLRKWLLSTMAVGNLLTESKGMRDQILLEDIPSGLNFLTQIIEALKDCRALKIRHRSFWRDAEYDIVIEPYCIKLFRQRWYVMGRTKEHDHLRVYALDRLVKVETLEDKFTLPEDFDAEDFFSDYFGVYVDPEIPLEIVRLKVKGVSCNYLRSLPLHHSQIETEKADGWSIFEYTIRPTTDFIGELVSMASYTKVLAPQWVADEVRKKIQEMVRSQE